MRFMDVVGENMQVNWCKKERCERSETVDPLRRTLTGEDERKRRVSLAGWSTD